MKGVLRGLGLAALLGCAVRDDSARYELINAERRANTRMRGSEVTPSYALDTLSPGKLYLGSRRLATAQGDTIEHGCLYSPDGLAQADLTVITGGRTVYGVIGGANYASGDSSRTRPEGFVQRDVRRVCDEVFRAAQKQP